MNTVLQRFINKVKINNTTGCWEWIGYKVKNGYGQFSVNAKLIYAHRWIYEYMNGKILQYPKLKYAIPVITLVVSIPHIFG